MYTNEIPHPNPLLIKEREYPLLSEEG